MVVLSGVKLVSLRTGHLIHKKYYCDALIRSCVTGISAHLAHCHQPSTTNLTVWIQYRCYNAKKAIQHSKLISNAYGFDEIEIESEIKRRGMLLYSRGNLAESLLLLKDYSVVLNDISEIACLSIQTSVIHHRLMVLRELGFTNITSDNIIQFDSILSTPPAGLQQRGAIPADVTDPLNHLVQRIFPAHPEVVSKITSQRTRLRHLSLGDLRRHLLFTYLNLRSGVTKPHMDAILKTYSAINTRSIALIVECVEIILTSFHVPTDRIRTNGFLLLTTPTNMRRLLEIAPKLGGEPVHVVVNRALRILTMPAEGVQKTNEVLREFGITDEQIQKQPLIFSLNHITVKKRLEELHSIAEFEVMKTYPRILALVYFLKKAKLRLEFLRSEGFQTTSLDRLTTNTAYFNKSTTLGSTSHQCRETIKLLSDYLGKPEDDIRRQLFKHNQARLVPILTVRDSLHFLFDRGFSTLQIYNGIQVLLYKRSVLERHLDALPELPGTEPWAEWSNHSNILQLLLYSVELDYNLEMRGVWEDTEFRGSRRDLGVDDLPPELSVRKRSRIRLVDPEQKAPTPEVYIYTAATRTDKGQNLVEKSTEEGTIFGSGAEISDQESFLDLEFGEESGDIEHMDKPVVTEKKKKGK